jgi:hypothetical protein
VAKAVKASRVWEADERLRRIVGIYVPTAARKVVGPENAIRKSEMKRPRPMWPRARRRSRASF